MVDGHAVNPDDFRRALAWEACRNVRDIGGLPVAAEDLAALHQRLVTDR
jgi:hypothetical protein